MEQRDTFAEVERREEMKSRALPPSQRTSEPSSSTPVDEPRITKDPSRARLSGGIFEMQLAGLASVRLRAERQRRREANLRYLLATNMADANPFDDIILRVTWNQNGRQRRLTYFVQLKHAEKVSKPVTSHDLTGEVSKRNKDFNLRKYFQFFLEIKRLKQMSPDDLEDNQRLLCEWAKDECRFVLFTTREVLPKTKDTRGTSQLDFPFEEVFSTEQGEVFCFDSQDSQVWSMFDGTEHEREFRTEFLPRLRVFSAQAQVSTLEPLLARVLAETVGASQPRVDWLTEKYSAILHNWWSSSDGTCLTENSTEIEEIVRENLHAQFENLQFKKRLTDDLQVRLRSCDAAYIVVPGIPPHLLCSRLWTLLDKFTSDRFVVLMSSTFGQYSLEILLSMYVKLCDVLVVCTNMVTSKMQTFIDIFFSRRSCKLWIVSSNWDRRDFAWLKSRVTQCDTWSENWSLEQLEHEQQRRLLGRTVSFQGHQMALAELKTAWPSLGTCVCNSVLGSLATGKPVVIGAPVSQADKHYQPRTLRHRMTMQPSVFQHCYVGDHFLLSGFPEEILQKLRRPDQYWQECLETGAIWSDPSMPKAKWSVWNNEKDFNEFKGEGSDNFHLLSYERQQIIWKGTKGDKSTIEKYVDKKCGECHSEPICFHDNPRDFLDWQDTTILLADTCGMGKSTFLTHLAHMIKCCRKSDWVVLIRIKQKKLLDELPQVIKIGDVIQMLTESVAADIVEGKFIGLRNRFDWVREEVLSTPAVKMVKRFLSECLQRTGKITVLVDGVDEVCPAQKSEVLRVLQLLRELVETSGGRLWVTSRTVVEEDLARVLACATPLSLQRFSPEDQKKFLLSRWLEDLPDFEETALENGVSGLVDAVREATTNADSSICDVPLYTKMLAEVYPARDLQELFSNKALHINKIALYTKFVQTTLGTVWEKAGLTSINRVTLCVESDQSMLEKHKMYAAAECFTDHNLGDVSKQLQNAVNELNNDYERERRVLTGIITDMVAGRPKFVHYTIQEFLAASWLRDNYSSVPNLIPVLYKQNIGEVRHFFDSLLADELPLHEATLAGRLDATKMLLKENKQNIDEGDSGGRRALHLAVIYGHHDIVRFLLNKGADVHRTDNVLRWSPMKYADVLLHTSGHCVLASYKKDEARLKVIEELIAGGAKLRDAKITMRKKTEVLRLALENGYSQLAQALITSNGPIYFQKFFQKKYIEIAALSKNAESLAMLVRLGFKTRTKLSNGETCLHMFAREGDETTCVLLLNHGVSVNKRNSTGNSPFDHAAHGGHEKLCHLLLDSGADVTTKNKHGTTALHHVAIGGMENLCVHVLNSGVDVNATNSYGESALSLAASRGYQRICELLLDRGADVNVADKSGHTVLHHAAYSGYESLCDLLLKRGANVNARNKDGESVLHYAAFFKRDRICRLLLDRGAEVNAASRNGDTVLHEGVYKDRVCELLLSYGADANAVNKRGETALHKAARRGLKRACALLLQSGAEVNVQNVEKETPLFQAARGGYMLVCRLLLDKGADVNVMSQDAITKDLVSASMIAGVYGHKEIRDELRAKESFDALSFSSAVTTSL